MRGEEAVRARLFDPHAALMRRGSAGCAEPSSKNTTRWTLDRGSGYYQRERFTKKKASLLGSGE